MTALQGVPDCGKCCGTVPFHKDRYARIRHRATVPHTPATDREWVIAVGDDARCAFLDRQTKQCAVHDDKPDICRSFGLSEHPLLACPFVFPDGRRRGRAAQRRVLRNTHNDRLKLLAVEAAP